MKLHFSSHCFAMYKVAGNKNKNYEKSALRKTNNFENAGF